MRVRWFLPLALSCGPALAEGARQTYDCAATLACDGAAACQPSGKAVTFAFEPLSLEPDGSGEYRVLVGDEAALATFSAPALEYLWSRGADDQQRLLVTGMAADGSVHVLWHHLDRASLQSALLFLTCEVTL